MQAPDRFCGIRAQSLLNVGCDLAEDVDRPPQRLLWIAAMSLADSRVRRHMQDNSPDREAAFPRIELFDVIALASSSGSTSTRVGGSPGLQRCCVARWRREIVRKSDKWKPRAGIVRANVMSGSSAPAHRDGDVPRRAFLDPTGRVHRDGNRWGFRWMARLDARGRSSSHRSVTPANPAWHPRTRPGVVSEHREPQQS